MHATLLRLAARDAAHPDGELIARFARDRDEAAFAALVHRHGPAVYGVCRRVLGSTADADDAFQAVFLVLANRAGSLAGRPAVGGWLHVVAVRVAQKARTSFARLRKHERRAARGEAAFDASPAEEPPAWFDRELAALPERFREPVVQCLVRERPRAEVAAELGIPEGTLASRLDAARKRLAGRLARYQVPLAVGGLLVAVPPTLTAAAVGRVADATGLAIHQLANEVTQAMFSKAKWAALGLLLTTAGGLFLVAAATPRPAPPPPEAREKVVPEPEWMKAFHAAYDLKNGEYVKRVAPPYIDERIDFELDGLYEGKGHTVDPKVDAANRKSSREGRMFYTLFVEQDGRRLTYRSALSSAYLKDRPDLQQGDNLLTVEEAVSQATGLSSPEFLRDPKTKGDPLFAEKNKTVHGDFVTRKDAPVEKLAPQLEKILRDECKLDVRLTVKDEEHEVFVVRGEFKPNPPAWRPKGELDLYADESRVNKQYNHFKSETWGGPEDPVKTSLYGGRPSDLLRFVGWRLGTRMVWDAPLPTTPKVDWHNHTLRRPTGAEEADEKDPDKVLKVVSEQTGLTFKKEKRTVKVLYLGVPEKKAEAPSQREAVPPVRNRDVVLGYLPETP